MLTYNVKSTKRLVLTYWILLRQKIETELTLEIFSRQLQRVWEIKICKNSWLVVAESGKEQ